MKHMENLASQEDYESFVLYQQGRRRLGLPEVSLRDYLAGSPAPRDSQPARKRVSLPASQPAESPFAFMGPNFKCADSVIAALEQQLLGREGVSLSDVGRCALILLKFSALLPIDSFRVNSTVADVARMLGINKGQMSKTMGMLQTTDLMKVDSSTRPAKIYLNPAMIWRGSTKEQQAAIEAFEAVGKPS